MNFPVIGWTTPTYAHQKTCTYSQPFVPLFISAQRTQTAKKKKHAITSTTCAFLISHGKETEQDYSKYRIIAELRKQTVARPMPQNHYQRLDSIQPIHLWTIEKPAAVAQAYYKTSITLQQPTPSIPTSNEGYIHQHAKPKLSKKKNLLNTVLTVQLSIDGTTVSTISDLTPAAPALAGPQSLLPAPSLPSPPPPP